MRAKYNCDQCGVRFSARRFRPGKDGVWTHWCTRECMDAALVRVELTS